MLVRTSLFVRVRLAGCREKSVVGGWCGIWDVSESLRLCCACTTRWQSVNVQLMTSSVARLSLARYREESMVAGWWLIWDVSESLSLCCACNGNTRCKCKQITVARAFERMKLCWQSYNCSKGSKRACKCK